MINWDDVIEKEISAILLRESKDDDEDGPTPLERLDDALKQLQNQDEIFEAIFAPYLVMRDIFKLAITGIQLVLNDVVFVVKKSLAIRPSSWAAAIKGHERRRAKLMKQWDKSMAATGADSNTASLISFLAFPGPMIAASMVDQGFKTVASINHGLIDTGIRLPLMSLLPGATPPEEVDMDDEELKKRKRGDLTTKDAVKVALMSIFFAHHKISGNLISEAEEEDKKPSKKSPEKIKVTPDAVQKTLEDIGVYDKTQIDLKALMDAKEESIEKFWESENPEEKIKQAATILKANSPESLVKVAKSIQDKDMSKAVNEYIKKFNEAAEKIANNKTFQQTFDKESQKKSGKESGTVEENTASEKNISKDEIKKEAIKQVFAKSHPQFKEEMTKNLAEYTRWVAESVESIYKVPKKALKNPIVKKSVDKKNAILEKLINNISP
tara:strand:+ start:174 stop:1493 length:1320 start_codon:yes stop_codon:yes gene_type:complete